MKVIRPLNRELTHEDVGKKIADIGEVCEEEGCIFCIPVEGEKYSYNIEDYTPKVKPGRWNLRARDLYEYLDPNGCTMDAVYRKDDGRFYATNADEPFEGLQEARAYVEEQYRKYVLSLIEEEE